MSLLKQTVLRYRDEGHLRFELPLALCQGELPTTLISKLRNVEGIYRVDLSDRQRKLSIRYLPAFLDFKTVLAALVSIIESAAHLPATTTPPSQRNSRPFESVVVRLKKSRVFRWMEAKAQEARETVSAMKIVANRQFQSSSSQLGSGPLLTVVLNELLLFYLIKVHWQLITRYWLRRPLEYRYPLLASLYLVVLLVRSRRAQLR